MFRVKKLSFKKPNIKKPNSRLIKIIALLIAIFLLGAGIGYHLRLGKELAIPAPESQSNIYIAFLTEIYDKIQTHYWKKLSDKQLAEKFKTEAAHQTGMPQILPSPDQQGVATMVKDIFKEMDSKQHQRFVVNLAESVLKGLEPKGRSGLFSKKEKQKLQQRVVNVNPKTGKKEPTVYSKLVKPEIFYVYIKKFSPTTLDEFNKATTKVDDTQGLDTLIIDLRGNIGGSIDLLPYFLGPFIGKNEYAYEWLHQGNYKPVKTKIGWLPSLVRYKKVVVLINKEVQSSAEVVAATLKKYNVGVVVGERTKGWGTVEKTFELEHQIDLDQKYSVFLAHSLTLGPGRKIIEENGVAPHIPIHHSDWKDKLFAYFHYPELVQTVEEVWNNPPFPKK